MWNALMSFFDWSNDRKMASIEGLNKQMDIYSTDWNKNTENSTLFSPK